MQLEKSTHSAVKIMRHLHIYPEQGKASVIAKAVEISPQMVTRLATRLKRDGLVKFVPGRNGGFKLGRSADEISFYDIFVAAQGELCISHCFISGICEADGHCKAHGYLQAMQDALMEDMMGVSLVDLV